MKNNKLTLVFILPLILIEITSIVFMYKSNSNKDTILDNVKLKEEISKMNGIAIMLEQEDGTYIESSSNNWPTDMYFNEELSGCVDNLGNKVENTLTYENGIANVETDSTSYCYLYFDTTTNLYNLCKNYDNINECSNSENLEKVKGIWNSTLEDDGYRYVGTNPDNYICFGTDSKSECVNDTDKYMYRIIGIFEDSEGTQHLKLIKKEALNTGYAWGSSYTADIAWNESNLYKGINGSYFLTNTTYSYMQDTTWTSKISTWTYTMTNTLSYTSSYGPNYYYTPIATIYLHELNRSGKTSQICFYNASTYSSEYCSNGTWTPLSTKVSLMYVSDYGLSLGISALSYTGNINYSTLKTGWIHISNNDSERPSNSEWTMSRYGHSEAGYCIAYRFDSEGHISMNGCGVDNTYSARPVFYLIENIKITSGKGNITEPFIIN